VSTTSGDTTMHEITVAADSRAAGRQVVDLGLPEGTLLVLLNRDDDFVVPQGATMLRPGDKVLVLADPESLRSTKEIRRGQRERRMSRTRRRGAGAMAVGAALFAVAWAMGLWLIVLGLVSAAKVLARQQLAARRGLPARVAAWALHAPRGPSTPGALEHALAVDLATSCDGRLDCLRRAQAVVAEGVDDAWRRALGEERLARAQRLVADGDIAGVTAHRESSVAGFRRAAAVAALAVLIAVATLTQSRWWLVPRAGVKRRARLGVRHPRGTAASLAPTVGLPRRAGSGPRRVRHAGGGRDPQPGRSRQQ
jgi:hypothetical protein